MDTNLDTTQAVTFTKEKLRNVGVALNESKTAALPPMGHKSTARKKALLMGVRVITTEEEGAVVVGIPRWARTPS